MARADHPQPVTAGNPREGSSPRASVVPLVPRAPGSESAELLPGLTRIAEDSLAAHRRFVAEAPALLAPIALALADALGAGGKVLLCGNGGSAADAQHVAGELMGRFLVEREPWPAIALTTDTSILTAVGNDWTFDDVFARQVRALARPGDVVVGISTSGRSPNVVRALVAARARGARTIAFTGEDGRDVAAAAELTFPAPAASTPRVQELHILAWHSLCELVERRLVDRAHAGPRR